MGPVISSDYPISLQLEILHEKQDHCIFTFPNLIGLFEKQENREAIYKAFSSNCLFVVIAQI